MTNSSNIWKDTSIDHVDIKSGNKKCIIVIPVYKKKLGCFEEASLKQAVKVFGRKYELTLVCPMSLDVSIYNKMANYDFSVLHCSDDYFKSQRTYSDLCEEWKFYEALSEYEYMVIYQLDAWVFEDRLEYFINLDYDYIGAPHLVGIGSQAEGENGNGGFCLRKIEPFINVCKKTNFSKYRALEDCVFTQALKSNFKLAPIDKCREFSFQERPERQFVRNGNKLPMGCHAFRKFNWHFWKNYIKTNAWEQVKVDEAQINREAAKQMYGFIDGIDEITSTKRKLLNRRRVVKRYR